MWGVGRSSVGRRTSECGSREIKCWEEEPVNVGSREIKCWE